MLEFSKKPLETFEVVIQTGGRNAHVVYHFTNMLESLMPWAVGKRLTRKGVALVFDENKRLVGYIRKDPKTDLDIAIVKELETQELYFDDMYQRG